MRITTLYLRAAMVAAPILTVSAASAEESSAKPIKSSATVTTISAPAPLADGNYELGGFFGAGDKLEVSLKKKGESAAKWVRVGEKTGNLLVESADPKKGFAIVNISGSRYRLNLRGETATRLPEKSSGAVTISSGSLTMTSGATLAIRPDRRNESPEMKKKREQFESIMQGLTADQHKRIGETMHKKLNEALKNDPALAKGVLDITAMQKLGRDAFRDSVREAMQIPGKDGNAGSVPQDFNELFDAGTAGDAPVAGAVVTVGKPMIIDPNGNPVPVEATEPAPAGELAPVIGGSGTLILSSGGVVSSSGNPQADPVTPPASEK
jgi:hypothetical protein